VEGYKQANDSLRRLIPVPGAEALTPLSPLSMLSQSGSAQSNPVKAVTDAVGEQATSIVALAGSVLDEEMARGVLGPRRASVTASHGRPDSHGHPDATTPLLRQMHDFVDNLAAAWPSLQGLQTQRSVGTQPATSYEDPLSEVRPRATVKPGQRATISMTLRNSESRAVHLVPQATDLLGSRGGRIASSLLECTPSDITLQPQDERDLTIATTVPADAGPGCYSGLLVVRGLDYLRALITIEVV
jgi:hypothetical protein